MKENEFIEKVKERGLSLNETQQKQLREYADFLREYNEKVNLTAITDEEGIYKKHFYDSLLCGLDKKLCGTLVDVGTGAGFPGVVLKICFPELKVILLEPLNKRCVFLNLLIERLGLKGIEVNNSRGEDHSLQHREEYDYVTARAVTNLPALMEVCGAMVKTGGYFIALRGSSGKDEIEGAQKAIREMGFEVEEVVEERLQEEDLRIIGYLKKARRTALKYPRKYSIIKQRPL